MDRRPNATDFERIEYAEVEVRNGRPYSRKFNDIYFASDGPTEVGRVFLSPARILDRSRSSELFSICEFGFGSGLNFAVTTQRFLALATIPNKLRYISFEKYPLPLEDLRAVRDYWRHSVPILDDLVNNYPPPISGWHRRFFAKGQVELSLYLGDVQEGLSDFAAEDKIGIDAWFLDGFAPRKNPAMWSQNLLVQLSDLTRTAGTVTSFTASGSVRRTLRNSGFHCNLIDAKPHKRHTLLATIQAHTINEHTQPKRAIVVGAGLAGCATAFALANKGIATTIVDRNPMATDSTSTTPCAVVHARMSNVNSSSAAFRVHSHFFSSVLLKQRLEPLIVGVLQLPSDNFPQDRLERVAAMIGAHSATLVDADTASQMAGTRLSKPGLWFPDSFAISGQQLRQNLINHPMIELEVRPIVPRELGEYPVVIATGSEIPEEMEFPPLETATVAGQIDFFVNQQSPKIPKCIILNDGYICPVQGTVASGSTYEYQDWPAGEATSTNRKRLEQLLQHSQFQWHKSFRGQRVVTSDRLPIIGNTSENTWASLGHSSSGTTSTILGGELIASRIAGRLAPLSPYIASAIDPWRFKIRQQRRPNPFTRRPVPAATLSR